MGNFVSNVVEEKASLDGLARLFKEVAKILATVPGRSYALPMEGIFCYYFIILMYNILKIFGGKLENSEGSFNSLSVRKVCIACALKVLG